MYIPALKKSPLALDVASLLSIYETVQSVAKMAKYPNVSKGHKVLGFSAANLVSALEANNISMSVSTEKKMVLIKSTEILILIFT